MVAPLINPVIAVPAQKTQGLKVPKLLLNSKQEIDLVMEMT